MAGIQVAESNKKRAKKSLDHLEIHPKMGGGHVVKHVYTSYEHEPKEHPFNADGIAQGGEHIASHLKKHAGLPVQAHDGEEHEAEPVEDHAE